MKNSAATASFKDDGMTLDNLAVCLGSQSRRPLRSLVTGMRMALQIALPDEFSAQNPTAAMRAALRKGEGMEARLAGLLRDFPLVESVSARLTPWGNGDDIEKKLAGVAGEAADLYYPSPSDYLLARYARPISDDIQYSRRFLQALVDLLAAGPQVPTVPQIPRSGA